MLFFAKVFILSCQKIYIFVKSNFLKTFLTQYKPFFVFLVKFLLFYLVFTFIYKQYLNEFDVSKNEVDDITQLVANQTVSFTRFFEDDVIALKHKSDPSVKILYKGKYVARIIEGCNAVSVIILFAAFVFAFSSSYKKTLLFILIGTALVYILNIIRIALLIYALYYYPQYESLLHETVFPLFIYGVVFALWVLWVVKISGFEKNNRK